MLLHFGPSTWAERGVSEWGEGQYEGLELVASEANLSHFTEETKEELINTWSEQRLILIGPNSPKGLFPPLDILDELRNFCTVQISILICSRCLGDR